MAIFQSELFSIISRASVGVTKKLKCILMNFSKTCFANQIGKTDPCPPEKTKPLIQFSTRVPLARAISKEIFLPVSEWNARGVVNACRKVVFRTSWVLFQTERQDHIQSFWRDVVRSDQTGEWALIGAFWCLQWVRSNPKPTQEPIECISGTSGSIGSQSPSWLKNRPQYKRQLGLAKPRSRMDRKINFLDALEFIWVHQKTVTNFRQWFPAIPVALIQFQGTCASAYIHIISARPRSNILTGG